MEITGYTTANWDGSGLDLNTLTAVILPKHTCILSVKAVGYSLNIPVAKESFTPTPTQVGPLLVNDAFYNSFKNISLL